MAYNLEPLINILQQILNPEQKRWILDHHKKPEIESLLEKASSLKQILEISSPTTESLESRIQEAAHEAEDIIESHMVDQILSRPRCERFMISPPDLQQVIQQLDSATEEVTKIVDENQKTSNLSPAYSLSPDLSSKNIAVGLDEDLIQLKDRLTGLQPRVEIIPIVGMGGIGKTTLARNLYDDRLVVSHFDTRAWITVSQDYNVRAILLGLLGCIMGKLTDEMLEKKDDKLQYVLYQSLYGRRYLVVLDDIWSTNAWDDLKMFFPSNDNRSRIMLTTRESDGGKYADSNSSLHQMHLLKESESWDLLHQKVFGKENCPDEVFERIGRNIVSNCGGLPLAIHVIGGMLSKTKRTKDAWEHVANDVRTSLAENDEQLYNILSLSYNHLPNHLKPCFLYMGAFPEDYEIRASHLTRLWIAEGFLKSNGDKNLEEEAEDCLKALVDRNLLFIREVKCNGKPKSYSLHDLLRDLCMKKSDEAKFLHVKTRLVRNIPEDQFYSMRRVCVQELHFRRDHYSSLEFTPLTRSFLFTGFAKGAALSVVLISSRLLRVLDVYNMSFQHFPTEILQLVNLRYLAFSCSSGLPSTISQLRNLQTLIVLFLLYSSRSLPYQIWEMPELRHVKCMNIDFGFVSTYREIPALEKLQSISTININNLAESGILGSIPNIKRLGIDCCIFLSGDIDLFHLQKLETLKCVCDLTALKLRFPSSLRKLTLGGCTIPWGFMPALCALRNLEVLKLRYCLFESKEEEEETVWEATEGEDFCSLQFLQLEGLYLENWRADETNFPRLRRLCIWRCSELKEIPSGIGEILTLEKIELDESSPTLVDSAKRIQEEQRELGNFDLQVRIY